MRNVDKRSCSLTSDQASCCNLLFVDNFCSLDAASKIARAGARNFWGCDGYLPEFPQTCPKSFLCDFCLQIFSHKDHQVHFLALFVFLQTYGAVF